VSRQTPRLRWAQAIKSDSFPQTERVIRGTLLCLADPMTPTGEMRVWRDQMVGATGLPPRTLDRHLQRAVDAGWLIRETPAGRKRQSVYRTAVPTDGPDSSVCHSWRTEDEFCAPSTRIHNASSVRHLVANSIKKSASVSELQAVDDQRGRRTAPVESRAELEHLPSSKTAVTGEWAAAPPKRLPSVPRTEVA